MKGNLSKDEELYESIKPGHYYYSITKGNKIQRFWHKYKFLEVINCIDTIQETEILDIGCGPGTLLSMLPLGYTHAVGVDISKKQIKFAERQFKNLKNISWIASNIFDLKLKKNSFDFIFLIEVIEHLHKKDSLKLLNKIYNLLKKNGILILTTPNYGSFWPAIECVWNKVNSINYRKQHINKYDVEKMRNELYIHTSFREIEISTFFIFSPFVNLFSEKIAVSLLKFEKKKIPKLGSLILVKAKK